MLLFRKNVKLVIKFVQLYGVTNLMPGLEAVFHYAEFSARNDIFFCLLTPTVHQLVFKQRKCRSAQKIPPRGKWPLGSGDSRSKSHRMISSFAEKKNLVSK